MKLLVIEDDQSNADFLAHGLGQEKHAVELARTGGEGLAKAAGGSYDALIVDRMLPGTDGLSIVKNLRAQRNAVPILLLTAMDGIDDRVEGLEAGADDYLVKPFALSELLARLGAILRRLPDATTVLRTGDLKMDLITREVTRGGRKLELQSQEFKLLEYLLRNEGRVVTRLMLLQNVWNFQFEPKTTVVETHISRLRGKVDRGFDTEMIRTVRGVGYCLQADA